MVKEKAGEQTQTIAFTRATNTTQQDILNSTVLQQNKIQEYADLNNMEIVKWVNTSGYKTDESLGELLKEAASRPSCKIVLVSSIDRLGRNLARVSDIKQALSYLGYTLIVVDQKTDQSTANKFLDDMQVTVCRLYSEARSEGVKRGLVSRASQGYAIHPVPFGYKKTATKGLFEVSADGIGLKYVLKTFSTGVMDLEELRQEFSKIYYRTSEKLINKNQFERIITNPYYAGYIAYNDKLYEGIHVPLITKDEYKNLIELLG